MARLLARAAAFIFICASGRGCDPLGSLDLDGTGFGLGGCATATTCNEINISGPTLLLLGDTAGLSGSTRGSDTDLQWEHTSPAVSFVGSPIVISGFLGFPLSHVVVLGTAVGSSTITARRKSYSASTSIEVVSSNTLGRITIDRVRCAGIPAAFCDPTSQSSVTFRDTLFVGDTARVIGSVRDFADRVVTATIKWSSNDASVASTALVPGFFDAAQLVVGFGEGDAVITGAVAGLTSSFTLHVVKKP
jgi:hypothetical protein